MTTVTHSQDLAEYKAFAEQLTQEATAIMMANHGKMQQLEYKLRTNFKTQVDDEIDQHVRRRIHETYPDHNIYSEEEADEDRRSEWSWVVDPLDGTLPYTYGMNDHFGVCVALVKGKTPVLGIVSQPKREDYYLAELGKGATRNGQPIKVSDLDDLNKAMIGLDYGKLDRARILPIQAKLLAEDGASYTYCHACASTSECMVADGRMHGYLALRLEPWDMAAAVVVMREAGAKVTDIAGREWELGDESIVAANPVLHGKLLALAGGER